MTFNNFTLNLVFAIAREKEALTRGINLNISLGADIGKISNFFRDRGHININGVGTQATQISSAPQRSYTGADPGV